MKIKLELELDTENIEDKQKLEKIMDLLNKVNALLEDLEESE